MEGRWSSLAIGSGAAEQIFRGTAFAPHDYSHDLSRTVQSFSMVDCSAYSKRPPIDMTLCSRSRKAMSLPFPLRDLKLCATVPISLTSLVCSWRTR